MTVTLLKTAETLMMEHLIQETEHEIFLLKEFLSDYKNEDPSDEVLLRCKRELSEVEQTLAHLTAAAHYFSNTYSQQPIDITITEESALVYRNMEPTIVPSSQKKLHN